MRKEAIAVFTYRSLEDMVQKGGSYAWHVDRKVAGNCRYLICVRNRHNKLHPPEGPEEHSHAFMIALNSGIKDLGNGRSSIRFENYVKIDKFVEWKWRDKKYIQLSDFGLSRNKIERQFRNNETASLDGVSDLSTFADKIFSLINAQYADYPLNYESKKTFALGEGRFVEFNTHFKGLKFTIYFGPISNPNQNGFWCGFSTLDASVYEKIIGTQNGQITLDYEFPYIDNENMTDMYVRFGQIPDATLYGIGSETNNESKWIGVYKREYDNAYSSRMLDLYGKTISIFANDDGHTLPLDDLRARADLAFSPNNKISAQPRNIYTRCSQIRIYVLRRANGICECCDREAPFFDRQKRPYLESHHINQRSDEGLDHYRNMAAICPTCHRQIHSGIDGGDLNEILRGKILNMYQEQ